MQSNPVNRPPPSRPHPGQYHHFHWILGVMLLLSLVNETGAAPRTWTGGTSTDWSTAANWNPAGVPSAVDTVTVANGALVSLTQNVTVAGFDLNGSLTGAGSVTVTGTMNWTGGILVIGVTIPVGAHLNISGTGPKTIHGGLLNNQGTAVWSGTGDITGGAGGTIANQGLFEVQTDADANFNNQEPKPAFENRPGGVFRKLDSASRTTFSSFRFNNEGLVEILSGTLSLGFGGTNSGTFSNAANGTLEFTGGTMVFQGGATFALRGLAQVTGGALTLSGTHLLHAGGKFELAGGVLNGIGTFTGSGTFIWSSGSLLGTVNISPDTRMEISGAGPKTIHGGLLNNQGTVVWSGTGDITGGAGGTIANQGLFEAQSDADANFNNQEPKALFHNLPAGLFRKISNGETAFSNFNFKNEGLLSVQGGTMRFTHFILPDGTAALRTIVGVPPPPPFGGFGYTATVVPIRSSNPWRFTMVQSSLVPDLRVRVQSSLTPDIEGSWEFLPGFATRLDSNWTLDTIDVPTGARYFRAIATAPGYADTVTDRLAMIGPVTVLEGITPYGDVLIVETTAPLRTGTKWKFIIVQPSLVSDLRLRVQSSMDLQPPRTWNDLPGGGRMSRVDSKWTLVTSEIPLGTNVFRVVASAPTYADRFSGGWGPRFIEQESIEVPIPISVPGSRHILSFPELQDPAAAAWQVYFTAISNASVYLIIDPNLNQKIATEAGITLDAALKAAITLTIEKGQSVKAPGVTAGTNTTVVIKGEIESYFVAQAGNLIGHDAGSMVAGGGGNLVAGGGGNIANLVAGGGGNMVAGGGGNIVAGGGGNKPAGTAASGRVRIASDDPTFTGVMTVIGDFTQDTGAGLFIAIAGTNTLSTGAQEYDQLLISGHAELAGTIGFALFDPSNVTNKVNLFQPPVGAIFDVVVATNIVTHDLIVRGPTWGDGRHFNWSVVNRADGKQAVRLVAVQIAPTLIFQADSGNVEVAYPTNFTGYTLQRSPTLSPTNWTTFSTATNRIVINPTNTSGFFRLFKP